MINIVNRYSIFGNLFSHLYILFRLFYIRYIYDTWMFKMEHYITEQRKKITEQSWFQLINLHDIYIYIYYRIFRLFTD